MAGVRKWVRWARRPCGRVQAQGLEGGTEVAGDQQVVTRAAPVPGSEADVPAPRDWTDRQETALRLWIALARCYQTFARTLGVKLQDGGLTMAQFGVLEALRHKGPMTLGDLADKLLVTGGNVTYVMDRLEEDGLVYRERCGQDRRVIWAKLTPRGRALIDGTFPGHAELIESLASTLTLEEQEELRRLLKRLGLGVAERVGG